jgi:hypothetical protein
VTTRTGRSLSTLSVAGEPHPLPAAPGPAQCSTGDTLIADGRPPTRGPGGPISFDGRIPQPDDPGIALLPTRRSKWHAIGAPPAGASGGDRACSAGWILVLPWSTSGRHIAYRDAQTGEWRESPSLEFNSTPYTITNPDTPSFVVTDGTTTPGSIRRVGRPTNWTCHRTRSREGQHGSCPPAEISSPSGPISPCRWSRDASVDSPPRRRARGHSS